jgi:hypothetical protein
MSLGTLVETILAIEHTFECIGSDLFGVLVNSAITDLRYSIVRLALLDCTVSEQTW